MFRWDTGSENLPALEPLEFENRDKALRTCLAQNRCLAWAWWISWEKLHARVILRVILRVKVTDHVEVTRFSLLTSMTKSYYTSFSVYTAAITVSKHSGKGDYFTTCFMCDIINRNTDSTAIKVTNAPNSLHTTVIGNKVQEHLNGKMIRNTRSNSEVRIRV